MSIITYHGILSINGNKTLSRHLSGTPVIILSDILHHIKSSLTTSQSFYQKSLEELNLDRQGCYFDRNSTYLLDQ
jgi:hypothetical protein